MIGRALDIFVDAVNVDAEIPIRRVLLFGSRARGDYEPLTSDIDVAVLVDLPGDGEAWGAARRAIRRAVVRVMQKCDLGDAKLAPVVIPVADMEDPPSDRWAFLENIRAEGIPWTPGTPLPPPIPHDRDAPPPWRHLPTADHQLRHARENLGAVEKNVAGRGLCDPKDIEAAYRAAKDLLCAPLLVAGIAPPRTTKGQCEHFLQHVPDGDIPAGRAVKIVWQLEEINRAFADEKAAGDASTLLSLTRELDAAADSFVAGTAARDRPSRD